MGFLKDLKLRSKLTLGFSAILIIFMLSVLFGYFGLKRISNDFNLYRVISRADTMAGRVQANLLESRIAFKNLLQTGDTSQQKVFEERFSKMEGFIDELRKDIKDSDKENKINIISQYSKEYKDGFQSVLTNIAQIDNLHENVINVKATEIEKHLSTVMDSAFKGSNEKLLYESGRALNSLFSANVHVTEFLLSSNQEEKEDAKKAFSELDKWLDLCFQSSQGSNLDHDISIIKADKEILPKSFDEIASIIEENNKTIKRMDQIGPQIASLSEEIKMDIISQQDAMEPVVKKSSDQAFIEMLALSLIALLFSVLIIIIIVRIVIIPVNTVTKTFKEISEGEANLEARLKVNSKDELGHMAKYFNTFMAKLESIMDFNKKQSWFNAGEAELSEKIRGEQDIETLSSNIIAFVSKYVNAQIGAIYIKTEDNDFKLKGSYAYCNNSSSSHNIKLGEGLVGQAALEKKAIIVENIPEDYIKISSGTGKAVPRSILIVPCMCNNEVKCILELGSFDKLRDTELEFVEEISESIAISIQSAESHIKMKELLLRTIEQSEELQVQQEELRQSNEELEEQARALRESEAQLQSQHEELRVVNEELQERTKILEIQKNDILGKNRSLENAQIEIHEKASALETASKYKSEFLANMSHELRTPLNSILVLSQILSEKKDNEPLTDKQLEYASTIHTSGQDLLGLINDILDLSKVEAGKMDIVFEDLYINELAQYIERSFSPIAVQKGLDFSINAEESAPAKIVSDSQRIQQILNNLLSNAFKFTEQGGVSVTVRRAEKKDSSESGDFKDMVSITVSDTGIGIPRDKQDIIFEAFKQCDGTISRKYGGTGLGLSISRGLAELLGGRIELTSEHGKGSTFTLYIPVNCVEDSALLEAAVTKYDLNDSVLESNQLSDEFAVDMEKTGPGDKLLLIIEDDWSFSTILSDLAQEKGYKSITAKSGESGLSLASRYEPNAILLDIGLPDMSGWKVIEKLKMNPATKNIPVHVISGNDARNSPDVLSEITGYLKKPASLEDLDAVFGKIEGAISKIFKKLLIIDDDKEQTAEIARVIGSRGIQVVCLDNGTGVLELLKKESFDCMILDIKLKDMSGFELLKRLRDENIADLPVIIHTEKILTQDDEIELKKYAESIIIKGSRSLDRLVAEASLFLHEVESGIEKSKIGVIKSQLEKEDSLKDKKILIVDDDMRNVFALSSSLEEKGIKVVIGRNGREGIRRLDQNQDVDIILMDIMMPEMDGYTAMKEIRKEEKYRKIPIIALTAKAMKDDKQKCIEAGANDYMTKPIDVNKLISLLRVWLYK